MLYLNGEVAPQVANGLFIEVDEPQGPIGPRPACMEGRGQIGATCTKEKAIETLPNGVQPFGSECAGPRGGQYRCLHRSRGPLLFRGGQPGQLNRQPCASRVGGCWLSCHMTT